jgi:hypothetical protein
MDGTERIVKEKTSGKMQQKAAFRGGMGYKLKG